MSYVKNHNKRAHIDFLRLAHFQQEFADTRTREHPVADRKLNDLICEVVHELKLEGRRSDEVVVIVRELCSSARFGQVMVDRAVTECIKQYYAEPT